MKFYYFIFNNLFIFKKFFSVPAAAPNSSARAFASKEEVTLPIQSELQLTRIALAKSLNLAIGSQLTIISPQVKAGPFGAVPRSRSYTVGLVFDVGMYEYNRGFIFVPLDEAQGVIHQGK